MAITTVLSPGPVYNITQNTVYALPACRCLLYVDAGTYEQSADQTNFTAVTLTNNQVEVAGGFIRNTAGAADIRLVKM
jgi:hypothetical protein